MTRYYVVTWYLRIEKDTPHRQPGGLYRGGQDDNPVRQAASDVLAEQAPAQAERPFRKLSVEPKPDGCGDTSTFWLSVSRFRNSPRAPHQPFLETDYHQRRVWVGR